MECNFPLRVKDWNELISIFGDPKLYRDSKGVLRVDSNWEANNLVLLTTPLSLPKRVYCHRLLAPALISIFDEIHLEGLQHLIHTWDGCFNPRYISGTRTPSSHTFAVSVDVNASRNPMGVKWELNKNPEKHDTKLIEIFTKNGLLFGNDFKRADPMHFSLVYW